MGSVESAHAASGGSVTEKRIILNPRNLNIPQKVILNGGELVTNNPELIRMADQEKRDKEKRARLLRLIRIRQAEENGELLLCDADFD